MIHKTAISMECFLEFVIRDTQVVARHAQGSCAGNLQILGKLLAILPRSGRMLFDTA